LQCNFTCSWGLIIVEKNNVHLVKVNNASYWVYRYEGHLNGIDNAVVLLCWRENAFKQPRAMHAFLCTDTELSTQVILEYYSKRWPIEIFFRHTKGNLGLNQYQVRSTIAIDRFILLVTLTYLYCVMGTGQYRKFGAGLADVRKTTEREQVAWIYKKAQNNVPLAEILQQLKIA
jgi:hypothetical protein